MSFLSLFRIGALSLTLILAIVVLGLVGHFTFGSITFFGIVYDFEVLGIATASLTLLTLPVMLIVGALRRGAFTSMVVVELVWLSIVWILWLATAADSAQGIQLAFPLGCGAYIPVDQIICNELSAITGLSFVNSFLLMAYCITLLIFSIIRHTRGHGVWTSSVTETQFLAPRDTTPGNASVQPATQQYQYPPNTVQPHLRPTPQVMYCTPPPPGHSPHPARV